MEANLFGNFTKIYLSLSVFMVCSSYVGSPWNEGVSPCGSCWLLLSNLTPQVMKENSNNKMINNDNKTRKILLVLRDQCHTMP